MSHAAMSMKLVSEETNRFSIIRKNWFGRSELVSSQRPNFPFAMVQSVCGSRTSRCRHQHTDRELLVVVAAALV